MNIRCGDTGVTIPLEDAVHSELLKMMDPTEDINVPEFVGKYLDDVAFMLRYLTAHKDPTIVQCIPSLQTPHPPDQFKQALEMLKVVQFLDVDLGVRMVFRFIFNLVGACSTPDDIVALLFYPGEFEQLPLDEQKKSYELLLSNLGELRGGPGVK